MFSTVMEIVELSKGQILSLLTAYLQPDGDSRGNGLKSNFKARMILVFRLAEVQEGKRISPPRAISGNL